MGTIHLAGAASRRRDRRPGLRTGLRAASLWGGFAAVWAFILLLLGAAFFNSRSSSSAPRAPAGAATAFSDPAPSEAATAFEARPLIPAASSAPYASPQPTAVPSPVATGRVLEVMRPLISVCVMPPGRQPCDAATQKRWDGDPAAWQAEAAERGAPLPNEVEAYQLAVSLRIGMSDPVTRINVAKSFGLPAIFITGVWYLESPVGGLVEHIQVEIANFGSVYADLQGMRLIDDRNNALLTLPAGSGLGPGRHCRLSTGPRAEDACAFTPVIAPWPGEEDLAAFTVQAADGQTLDTFVPR